MGLLVIIYISLKVNDRGTVGSSTNIYRANFDTVSGLVRKVPVEVSGIPVGYVDDISLQENKAIVSLKVNREVKIFADSSVYIRDRGILGDRYVQLNPGSTNQPQLKDGDTIPKALSKSDFE